MNSLKAYYYLTKPGIIRGNMITAAAGFFLASQGHIDFWQLIGTLLGIALVIACGCVLNNYIDRGIDKKMARTKKRALVTGAISPQAALIYAAGLGAAGFTVLSIFANLLTVAVGMVGLVAYVVIYGYFKRHSAFGTIVGSISGATPPVAGYTAVTGELDAAAGLLFLILTLWQMPHFYAIAMYRKAEYVAAGIPVLPAEKGMRRAQRSILLYILAFTAATALLTILDYTGYTYLIVMLVTGLVWFGIGVKGLGATDQAKWARQMFGVSLLVILVASLMIAADTLLP